MSRFVFSASINHSAPATTNATGKIKTAFYKFPKKKLASRPTISGDHMSPKRWIVKMETTMGLARRFTGAVSKMTVLTGLHPAGHFNFSYLAVGSLWTGLSAIPRALPKLFFAQPD